MLTFTKGFLIYNDQAGDEDIERKLAEAVPVLSKSIKELTVFRPDTIEESNAACEKAGDTDLFIILGGDGTVHHCINIISRLPRRPTIAILPGGTSNDFSRTLNIPQNFREAAEAITHGEIIDVDVGKSDDQFFLNFLGVGLAADTSRNVDGTQKKNIGVLSYMVSTLKMLNHAESFPYTIKTADRTMEGEAVMLFVLNGKYIATTEWPIAPIRVTDGLLDIIVVKNSSLLAFRELLSLRRSNSEQATLQELEYFQTNKLQIQTPTRHDIDMDGEIGEIGSGVIQVLPGHLRMVQGLSDK